MEADEKCRTISSPGTRAIEGYSKTMEMIGRIKLVPKINADPKLPSMGFAKGQLLSSNHPTTTIEK